VSNGLRHTHAALTVAWLLMVPIALASGWLGSIVFVSACSVYANAVGHFSARGRPVALSSRAATSRPMRSSAGRPATGLDINLFYK
jgi:ABC-type Mn2+/Zn2+ transport system permease subunit